MCQSLSHSPQGTPHVLLFRAMAPADPSLSFACSAEGRVELDALSPAELNRYLYARVMVGRLFHLPAVHTPCTDTECAPLADAAPQG